MKKPELAIWWLSHNDLEAIEKHGVPTWLPEWCAREVRSAFGRPGRGRLWVAAELGPVPPANFDNEIGSAIETAASHCAGIVIFAELVQRLVHLPGFVTTFDMQRRESL